MSLDRVYKRLLVLRCQTGDESAFAELVARYHARLRRFIGAMLGDPHNADDVLQDVWFDAWRGIGRLRDAMALEAWLFRIARDRAYRMLRRRSARLVTEPLIDVVDGAEVELDEDERRIVTTAVQRLPLPQREVLLLRFVEQMSYEQIAVALACELGTVRSRLHYAKRTLRELIERNGYEQPE
jgi:RNA polymerase sigma-70 factor (ECF subfamily)